MRWGSHLCHVARKPTLSEVEWVETSLSLFKVRDSSTSLGMTSAGRDSSPGCRVLPLKAQLHPSISGAPKRGKPKNFRIMLVRQIVDPAKDRQVRVYFIFRRYVNEAVIFNVKIRS